MNRLDFMDMLSDRGIVVFDYDESMLSSELRGIAAMAPDEHDRQ